MTLKIHHVLTPLSTFAVSESEVIQSCPPLWRSLPGSSLYGIFQASVLDWSAIAFSVESNPFTLFKKVSAYKVSEMPLLVSCLG